MTSIYDGNLTISSGNFVVPFSPSHTREDGGLIITDLDIKADGTCIENFNTNTRKMTPMEELIHERKVMDEYIKSKSWWYRLRHFIESLNI